MTTIAVDKARGFIAADRQWSEGNLCYEGSKIHKVKRDDGIHLVACSGDVSPWKKFLQWYEHGGDDDPLSLSDDEDFIAVILTPSSDIYTCDRWLVPDAVPCRFYASGTGGDYVLGALTAGMGIDKAMRAALKLDPSSGFGYDIEYICDVNK